MSREAGGSAGSFREQRRSVDSGADVAVDVVVEPYVLSGSSAHHYITIPPYIIPQTLAFSFLQMNWLYDIVKVTRLFLLYSLRHPKSIYDRIFRYLFPSRDSATTYRPQ